MTYREAYDKIIAAYFKDEIQPWESQFCFCGNLNDKNPGWGYIWDYNNYYSYEQYNKMEYALLDSLFYETVSGITKCADTGNLLYEEKLFDGMSAALDVLKQIHIERGEIIDEVPEVTKRELV